MVGTLTFDLSDEDDREEFKLACDGGARALVIEGMKAWLRNKLKYGHEFKTPDEALEAARASLFESLEEEGVNYELR